MFLTPLEIGGWNHSELHSHLASRCSPPSTRMGALIFHRSLLITFDFWGTLAGWSLAAPKFAPIRQEVGRKSLEV